MVVRKNILLVRCKALMARRTFVPIRQNSALEIGLSLMTKSKIAQVSGLHRKYFTIFHKSC